MIISFSEDTLAAIADLVNALTALSETFGDIQVGTTDNSSSSSVADSQ